MRGAAIVRVVEGLMWLIVAVETGEVLWWRVVQIVDVKYDIEDSLR